MKALPAYVALIVGLLLASVQGNRIASLRDGASFHRWLINASTQMQTGSSLVFDHSPDLEPMDDVFFAEVADRAEGMLSSDIPVNDELDYTRDGELRSLLVRHANHGQDAALWRFASNAANADLRDKFREYLQNNQLQSAGTQLRTSDLYGSSQGVYGTGLTSMFLGFRQLAANFVWLQVDKHWHTGQVHRMVPLMRTCVTLDPHFVDAYLVGAWHMAFNLTANLDDTPERSKKLHPKYKKRLGPKEEWYYIAIDYLKDGVRKNPRDYRLYFDLGYGVYELKLGDHANAVRYLREARRHRHERWVPRMLCRALTNNGEYEEAIEGWQDYLEIFPDSEIAKQAIVTNDAHIAEAIYQEYNECESAARLLASQRSQQAEAAENAGDSARAEGLRAEAKQARADAQGLREQALEAKAVAIQKWTDIYDTQDDDSLAQARILRLQALDSVQQGRYLEAVAELEAARWNHPVFFAEATNMILDIKTEHGLLMDVSEQLAAARRAEEAQYIDDTERPPEIHRIECGYRDHAQADSQN